MQDRIRLNHVLGRIGLGQLNDPGLVGQLAFFVRDHEHFRQLLVKCVPEERRHMYEAMRPHLRFAAHSLDQYISDAARIAEQRQYPVVGEDGRLHPFRPAEITTEAAVIQNAIAESLAKEHLHLVCRKCTREEVFHGARKSDAIANARAAGWTYDEIKGDGREICPKCPATRNFTD